MTTSVLIGVGFAWAAGAGFVAATWNRHAPLPVIAWLGLAGLLGPFTTGSLLLAAGSLGVPPRISMPAIAALSCVALGAGLWRRRRVLPRAERQPIALVLLLVIAIGCTSWIANRTHLGWDGTVVWYHKARVLAASDGRMPSATLADRTRIWMAPDYPLHVPAAMAWVRLWQPTEDERAIKVMPAAWCAALLLVVAAAVRDRSGSTAHAAGAVAIVATSARLLIGEGSYTSGYADGPLAGLLAILVWLVWRNEDDTTGHWLPLIAIVGVAAAWTKQEGLVGAIAAGAACAWQRRSLRLLLVAGPAVLVTGMWQAWVAHTGAATAMAYTWPGAGVAVSRWPVIVGVYAETWADVRTWGLLWPGLAVILALERRRVPLAPAVIVVAMATAGTLAFLTSAWPDVRAHLLVTVPRLLIALVPATVILALGSPKAARET